MPRLLQGRLDSCHRHDGVQADDWRGHDVGGAHVMQRTRRLFLRRGWRVWGEAMPADWGPSFIAAAIPTQNHTHMHSTGLQEVETIGGGQVVVIGAVSAAQVCHVIGDHSRDDDAQRLAHACVPR